jgi:methylenetetrahydrofolate reductase (NADPH)
MQKITDILNNKKFTKSIEFVPVRNGENYNELLEKIGYIKELGVDFISITKSAGGSLRGGTLPISYFAKEKYNIIPIAHFTCMDCSKQQIETELMDYHYMGLKNILALRGDPPIGTTMDEWKGEHRFAFQLVKQISDLNKGMYLPRQMLDKGEFREGLKTDFCIGVAAHPEENDLDKEISYLKLKVEKGAEFAITQMIFDAQLYKKYIELARKNNINIPIIPGVRPITKFKQITFTENLFKVKINEDFKQKIKGLDEQNTYDFGVNYTIDLCKRLKKYGAPGIHLFLLNNVELGKKILEKL